MDFIKNSFDGFDIYAYLKDIKLPVEFDRQTGKIIISVNNLENNLNTITVYAKHKFIKIIPANFYIILKNSQDNPNPEKIQNYKKAFIKEKIVFNLPENRIPINERIYKVAVAGTFNNWSNTEFYLKKNTDNEWTGFKYFEAGNYEYKFVINDNVWLSDPDNYMKTGQYNNSLLIVGDRKNTKESKAKISKTAKHAIIYQIMVPKFCDSDNDGFGDFEGIINKLPYLKQLGINWIYLLPIFKSPSQHGYHTTDYFTIDEKYGDIEDFKKLINACHNFGIKIMLDYVFNHSSADHPLFRISYKNKNSIFRQWFKWSDANNWMGFGGINSSMPCWNFDNREVVDYAINTAKYWQSFGIDGFRCDVAHNVPDVFWKEWSDALKQVNPDILLFPEFNEPYFDLYYDGSILKIIDVINGSSVFNLDQLLITEDEEGKIPVRFLNYHDKDRVLSFLDAQKNKLAATLMMTVPGVPMIYYGEEIGMSGKMSNNTNRQMMDWEFGDNNVADYYRKLINLRASYISFREGEIIKLGKISDDRIYAYIRRFENENILVVLNLDNFSKKINVDFSKLNDNFYSGKELFPQQQMYQVLKNKIKIQLNSFEGKIIFLNKQ